MASLLSGFPAVRTLDSRPTNLPVQPTTFIGREWETAEVERLLFRTRLLTLIGPGGAGKTRLALHLVWQAARRTILGVSAPPIQRYKYGANPASDGRRWA